MHIKINHLSTFVRELWTGLVWSEDGQDLVEYAILLALIALGATASMNSLANQISTAFTTVGTNFSGYTT